jgi:hypothetical protein
MEFKRTKAMFVRGTIVSVAALLATAVLAGSADAEHRQRRIFLEERYYPAPPIIRDIPGLRIFFGDYALSEEEFDALYGTPRRVYREDGEDEPPKRKTRKREQQKEQQKPKSAAKPAEQQKKTASKAPAAKGLSCEKATSVVTGYGFSSVTPSSCSGKVYAFNAVRDGKSFAIKLNPANGELTEVKKLP